MGVLPKGFTLLRRKPRSSRHLTNALRVPYEARTSAVGYASEGSACLREAASAKAGPTKHVEELRASARGGSTRKRFGMVKANGLRCSHVN
jgi:hypothetical protein